MFSPQVTKVVLVSSCSTLSLWRWLWVVTMLRCCFGCLEQERVALLQIKANVNKNDPLGLGLPYWVDDAAHDDCCRWEGVECNTNTNTIGPRLTKLSLNSAWSSAYNWDFNASLFLPFQELRTLVLSGNSFAGWVENEGFGRLSGLRNLQVLDLSRNGFHDASVLSSLTGLSSLKYLNLSFNRLQNGFGRLILGRGLSNLEDLDLSSNQLSNSILPSIRGLLKLKLLNLSQNQLQGSIHVEKDLCALSNLEDLDMSGNDIDSFVNPGGIKSLEQLKVLNLNSVKLNTSNLMTSLKSLVSASPLVTLYLQGNNLSGGAISDARVGIGLEHLSTLEALYLDDSSLTMEILQSIRVLTSLKVLSSAGCSLRGTLPNQGWCELRKLQELVLSGNQLAGNLPDCLANLTYLRVLDLSDNELTGDIASSPLTALTSLEYLSLSNNKFQVPVSLEPFANHSKLKVLLCDQNIMTTSGQVLNTSWVPKFQLQFFSFSNGSKDHSLISTDPTLPSFLRSQHDLRIIDLSHNFFSGAFPNWLFENNTKLVGFCLSDNNLGGYFMLPSHPNPNIMEIDFSNNRVGGRIPPNISSIFPNLKVLDMSRNEFHGNLNSHLFHDMNSLALLDLSNNLLSGVLPEYFVLRCPSLSSIRLSRNNLSGQIPPSVFNNLTYHLLSVYLDGNGFVGNIPDSLCLLYLITFDVSDNHFSGELPRCIGNMTVTYQLIMSRNHFHGPIPVEICRLTNLLFLDLSENDLTGSVPSCFNLTIIQNLYLHKNRLEGPMPPAFYNSSWLGTLDLRDNYFSGSIPTWISSISSLSILLLKGNRFEGNIPIELCQLLMLTILDISHNNLSGPLPPCLGTIPFQPNGMTLETLSDNGGSGSMDISLPYITRKVFSQRLQPAQDGVRVEVHVDFTTKTMSYSYKGYILVFMSGIDLSCNQLSGEIPPEIGNLSLIRALNLSHNYFTGPIPVKFSNLRQVESLDLSYNNLNGRIPSQLTELNSLAVFSVAHNNLSGGTPDRKAQFATFEESSYAGNPLLCGLPLPTSCNGIGPKSPPMPNDTSSSQQEEDQDGFIDMGVFRVSFVASYVTILLAIFGVLYINPYWRQAWFHFLQVCITRSYYFVVDKYFSKVRNMLRLP